MQNSYNRASHTGRGVNEIEGEEREQLEEVEWNKEANMNEGEENRVGEEENQYDKGKNEDDEEENQYDEELHEI